MARLRLPWGSKKLKPLDSEAMKRILLLADYSIRPSPLPRRVEK